MKPERRSLLLKTLVSASVTAVLLAVLFSQVDIRLEDLTQRPFRPGFLLLAFIAYLWVAFTRALRFATIHQELRGTSMTRWLQVAVIHSAVNQVLPFRTGEMSYVYLMRRIHHTTVGRSMLVLLVTRVFDLMLVFLFCLAFTPLVGDGLGVSVDLAMLVCAGVVFACLLALLLLRPSVRLLYTVLKRLAPPSKAARGDKPRFMDRLRDRTARLVAEAGMFREPRHFFLIFLISAAMWTGLFVTFFGLLNGFGFPIGLPRTIVGSVGAVLTNVLPVNGVANVGTLEAGWTLGLVLVGFSRATALAAAVWTHVGVLSITVILGLAGYITLAARAARVPGHDAGRPRRS